MFDAPEILSVLVGERGWQPLGAFQPEVSPATLATELRSSKAAADVRAHISRHGEVVFHALRFSRYPHIVLCQDELKWTSVHLALRKL